MLLVSKLIFGLCALLVSQPKLGCALLTLTSELIATHDELDEHTNYQLNTPAAKPYYAIAHPVLTVQGVKDALSHGANAVEIEFQPWSNSGW